MSRSGWIRALLVPLLAIVRYGVIGREEHYLERTLGAEYTGGRARVHRWV